MAIKKTYMAALLGMAAILPLQAQQTKVLTADKSNDYGLVYTLPLTALHIDLTARREVAVRGPFYQYAKKYLGDATPVTENSEKWTLEKCDVSTYGVPDPEVQYLMQLRPGSVTSISVDDNGMLLAINTEVDAPESPAKGNHPVKTTTKHIDPAKEYLKYVDEDFIASQSLAKQAQMLAEALMEVRDSRISLTRGTADTMPADGRQLELMLNSLQEQEAALTAAFAGVKWSETEIRGFDAVPEGNGETIICRLSDFEGFVDPDDLSGAPITLVVREVSEGTLPVDAKGEPKKLPKDAVVYNIPGSAEILLTAGDNQYFSREMDFAQFGVQFGLAPSLFSDRKEPYCAIFNPVTGALTEVSAIERTSDK